MIDPKCFCPSICAVEDKESLEAGHKALYKCELSKEEQLTGKFSTSKI